MNEKHVKNAVCGYFAGRLFHDFSVLVDDNHPKLCAIHFGSTRNGIADVVLRNAEGHFVAIAESKAPSIGITDAGKKQLASYLSATGTRFGILAASINSDDWIFAENLGANKFQPIDKPYFEEHVFDPPTTEWTQQNVLKWKSIADKYQSDAGKYQSDAGKYQSDADKYQSDADKYQSDAGKYQSIARWTKIFLGISVAAIIFLLISLVRNSSSPPSTNGSADRGNLYQVSRIIDGDTIEIEYEGAPTSVQLIGVNAPETVHPSKPPERFGKEATAFIQSLLLYKYVYFDFDGDKKDKYNRLLAYVYRNSDDLFVNVEIIRQGYGQTDARFPFKYMNLFKYHESEARSERKIIWSR